MLDVSHSENGGCVTVKEHEGFKETGNCAVERRYVNSEGISNTIGE